jgi:ribosomal protein S18 acetylase RimI-like enzyme
MTTESSAEIRLRRAQRDDTEALARIFVAAFQHGYPDVLPADVLATVQMPGVVERARNWTGAEDLETVVADHCTGENAHTPAGFTRFGDGYLAALYVDPAHAGAGVGRALLAHACRRLTDAGATSIRLWVFRDNYRARRLYESAGFIVDGRESTDPEWRVPQIGMSRRSDTRPPAGQ